MRNIDWKNIALGVKDKVKEESKAFWSDHSDSSDVKRLKSRMKLLIDRVDLLEERINKLDSQSLKSRIDRKTFNSN